MASSKVMVICLVVFAVSMGWATIIEATSGTAQARSMVYNAVWFEFVIFIGCINLLLSIFTRKLYKPDKISIFVFHIALVVIIIGAAVTRYVSYEGTMIIKEGEKSSIIVRLDRTQHELPFSILLNEFVIDYYPGSNNPSGFESRVTLIDAQNNIEREHRIFMNNILKYKGYRFYQNSYSKDKKGTILSVSKDALGTAISYTGYFLLALGMIFSLFNKNSRFFNLVKNKASVLILVLFAGTATILAGESNTIPVIPPEHADKFGDILVRDYQGRTKPMSTLVSDILRKVNKSDKFGNQQATQIFLGILVYPEKWQNVKLIYAGTSAAQALELNSEYLSLYECYNGRGSFVSSTEAYKAHQKSAANRTKIENSIIKFDERLNITYHWFMGNMLTIFPVPESDIEEWYNPIEIKGKVNSDDSVFVENIISLYLAEVKKSVESGDWTTSNELVESIVKYQRKHSTSIPSVEKVKMERWYYKSGIFKRSTYLYLLFGLFLLIVQLILVFQGKRSTGFISVVLLGGIVGTLLLHTFGIAIRWYISDRAPLSNTYETMIYIAWSAVIAGSIFIKRNSIVFSIAAIMAAIFLLVANLSWMDPQISNLVPVLRSVWLVIHVAVITSSYGFLGIGALMGLTNMILMSFQNRKTTLKSNELINNLTRVIEITLTIGLYLLTIGTFLGAVWANVSWGRYWGWDPKETWALITVIVYAVVLHFRLIPALKNRVLFNIASLVAYASVLMTYFGVNFYLSGLHSYAQGEPAPIPNGVFYSIGAIVVLSIVVILNQSKLKPIKG